VGRFQWTALAVCGLANASDAVEILGLSLVLPAAEEELRLTAAGKSALSSCIFVGELARKGLPICWVFPHKWNFQP
jgi:VNT family MFS transporter (synaptic vesicle glycoprotein 2)